MSIWSLATMQVKIDREKCKLSVRDMVNNLNVEGQHKVEYTNFPDNTQLLTIHISDSTEVDVFSNMISRLVNTLRQSYGVLWAECNIEGRL